MLRKKLEMVDVNIFGRLLFWTLFLYILDDTNNLFLYLLLLAGQCAIGTHRGVEAYMRRTARITEKFSGRQLAKMMISCQGMIYGTEESTLRPESYWTLVQRKVEEHKRKVEMVRKKTSEGEENAFNYA
jgi:hypothetical protein